MTHRVLHKRRAVHRPCTFRRWRVCCSVHARSIASARHGTPGLPLQTKREGQQPHPVVLPETSPAGGACLCCAEGPAEIPAGVSRAARDDAPRATGAATAPHFPQKDAPGTVGRVRAAWPGNLKMARVLGAACMAIARLPVGTGERERVCVCACARRRSRQRMVWASIAAVNRAKSLHGVRTPGTERSVSARMPELDPAHVPGKGLATGRRRCASPRSAAISRDRC